MLETIIRLIFPPKCIFCGQILDVSEPLEICVQCLKKAPFMHNGLLLKGHGIDYGSSFDYAFCLFEYSEVVKDALIRFKFNDKPGNYRAFAALLAKEIKSLTKKIEFDIIMAIPLHRRKRLERGYNQSNLISKALSREFQLPDWSHLVTRVKDTTSQSLLGKSERRVNVEGAFNVREPGKLKGKRVLLVDDVMTTGCTMDACSRSLLSAGASSVIAAVIATGRRLC